MPEEKIKQLTGQLAEIFNRFNAKYCKRCKDKYYGPNSGCCSGCAHALGYFEAATKNNFQRRIYFALRVGDEDQFYPETLQYLAQLKDEFSFDKEFGFFRKNKGCLLPRHKRSYTCLAFMCKTFHENTYGLSSKVSIITNQIMLLRRQTKGGLI